MSKSYEAFCASEAIQTYVQGQCALATGFAHESPEGLFPIDVYAHMDCGLRHSINALAQACKWESINLATLDSVTMRNPPDDRNSAYQADVWLTDMGGLFGMPDYLQPFNPITIN